MPNTLLIGLSCVFLACSAWESQAQTTWTTHNLPIYNEEPETEALPWDGTNHYYETMPLLEGCADAPSPYECSGQKLIKAVYPRLRYPEAARITETEGIVVVSFKIQKDGTMTELKILRDLGNGLGEEALRVLKIIQKEYTWTPGTVCGKAVVVGYTFPVRFRLKDIPPAEAPPIDR